MKLKEVLTLALIAACGILEMARYLPEKKESYLSLAKQMAHSLARGYAVPAGGNANGLLLHGSGQRQRRGRMQRMG